MEWLLSRLNDSLPTVDVGKGMVLNKESDIAFAKRNIDGLKEFLDNESLLEYTFEDTNGYLRRYLYDTVERRFPSLTMKKNAEGKLCAYKLDQAASLEHKLKAAEEAKARFEADAGFRLVFDALVEAKKPLVGHNLFFDLLFMLRWLDCPLPKNFSELKDKLHSMFPTIYDTKYLAASGILGEALTSMSTTLGDVYKLMMSDPLAPDVVAEPISTAEGFPAFLDPAGDESARQFHNAGYDAFCTGCVFAREASTLDRLAAGSWRESSNKMLFMMRSMYHMSLIPGASDGPIKVNGFLYNVTGFAKETKTGNIHEVFSKAFDCEVSSIEVIWVDDNSFFVVVSPSACKNLCERNGIGDSTSSDASTLYALRIAEQTNPFHEKAKAETAAAEEVGAVVSEPRPWVVLPYAEYLSNKVAKNLSESEGCEDQNFGVSVKRARIQALSLS